MATETDQYEKLYVPQNVHGGLKILADKDHRTMGREVVYLVEKELQSRGIDPDTLEPIKAGQSGEASQ